MTARSRVQKLVEMAKAQYPKTTKETVATTLSYSIDETPSIEEIDKLLLEFEDNIISHGVPADIDYDAGTVSTFQETLKNINLFEFIDDDPTYLYNYEPKQTNENLNEDPQVMLTKKRTRKPDNWKRNIKKLAKNKGEEYVSESGSIVKSKVLKAPCVNC
ncbi:unnamed protein product [Macrosiphum euphorbiae]|uniref:Uncharacterized protein n=1 Tax=Macrosiphum euphorbiae TaxID=13131 RepID=A0AAV0WHD6_9HEMI|nr:unnamed protein product [Macrosiphum euphorbiae]